MGSRHFIFNKMEQFIIIIVILDIFFIVNFTQYKAQELLKVEAYSQNLMM